MTTRNKKNGVNDSTAKEMGKSHVSKIETQPETIFWVGTAIEQCLRGKQIFSEIGMTLRKIGKGE